MSVGCLSTVYSNLLHVSSRAGAPGSSLLYFSSLPLLMKLQVYCGHIPALVSMCPEITAKQWEVCGWGEWYGIQIVTAASQIRSIFTYLLRLMQLFAIGLAQCFPAIQTELPGMDSSHFRGKFHHLVSPKTEFLIAWMEVKSLPSTTTSPLNFKWLPQH